MISLDIRHFYLPFIHVSDSILVIYILFYTHSLDFSKWNVCTFRCSNNLSWSVQYAMTLYYWGIQNPCHKWPSRKVYNYIEERYPFLCIYPPRGHPHINYTGTILGMGSANERRRYVVTSSVIGWSNSEWFPLYISLSGLSLIVAT